MNIAVIDHESIMNALVRDQSPPRISSNVQRVSQTNFHSLKYDHFNCLVINNRVLSNDEIKEISDSIRDTYYLERNNSGGLVQADSTRCQELMFDHENDSTSVVSEIAKHACQEHDDEFCEIIDCTGSIELDSQIARLLSIREYIILNCMNRTSTDSVDFLFYDGLKYLGKVIKDTHVTLLDLSDNCKSCEAAEYLESIRRDIQSSSMNVEIITTECDSFNALVRCREKTKPTTLDLSCNEKVRENCLDFLAPILQGSPAACLDLSNNFIKCESLKLLAQCLEGTKVQFLNLSCNVLDSDAINCLALTLKSTEITSIDLCYAAMDNESLKILTSCLKDTKISSINLSGNTLSYDAINCLALALPNTHITSIDLSDTTMNCEGLQVFASNLADSKIVSLNLSGNLFGYDGINHLANVLKNTQITSIDLSKNNINCESLNVFSSCLMNTKISSLSLRGNKLGNDGVISLSQVLESTKITSIDLGENCITCEGLKVLASCLIGTKISSLDLSNNKFGYDSIKYLASFLKDCEITNLNLSNNSINCNSLKNFVLCLPDTKLITLDISGNNICCNTFYLASVLENTRITDLNLSNNKFHHHNPKKLIFGLKYSDAYLDLNGKNVCSLVFYYLSSALKGTKIISLNLSCIDIDFEGLKYLSQGLIGSSVVSLDLSNNKINCNNVHYLAQVLRRSRISSLNLSNNKIGFHGLKYLVEGLQGSQIELLNLSNNPLGDKSFEYLAKHLKCTGNIELDLYGTKISPGAVYDLLKIVVRRGENYIARISFNDDVPFKPVNIFRYPGFYIKIDQLLTENEFHYDDGFDWTLLNNAYKKSGITKVVYYHMSLSHSHSFARLSRLFDNVDIRQIELKTDLLDFRTAALFRNSKVAELKVNCKNFRILDRPSMQLISLQFYRTNTENDDGNSAFFFVNPSSPEDPECSFRNWYDLAFSKSLVSLRPKSCFNDHKLFIINNIMYLDLRSIDLGDDEFQYLPEFLKNSNIISLNLSNNKIGAKGLGLLAEALPYTNITYIDLHGNNIGYLGYVYILNVVSRTNICWLSLGGNNIEKFSQNDIKLYPYVVSRKDCPIAFQIRYLFRELVSLNSSTDEFEFIVPQELPNPPVNLSHYPFLMKKLLETPVNKIHIYDMIYMSSKKHDIKVFNKIGKFIESMKDSFCNFIDGNMCKLASVFDYDSFVDLVKTCEYLEFDNIVHCLLLHRVWYYVNEDRDILHPFIYKMLRKYDLPLFIEAIEPDKEEKIINYFQTHPEIDGAKEIIDMLGSGIPKKI